MSQIWRTKQAEENTGFDTPNESTGSVTSTPGSTIELRSLAPEYDQHQHATYVRHLESAILEPKNRNIALTGRYGSGKSSILDHFLEGQGEKQKKTLRISINTLGPDDDEDLTNRIQKELVKQLVYRAKPGEIRRSRFARREELTLWRALRDAVMVGVVLVGLLWLFGVRPDPNAFGTNHAALPMASLLLLVVTAAWAVRWLIGNRLISQFSTGGTSILLEKQSDSYFDEYLDEIVAFFDATEPDFVVFEDLDRFDDPRIFDSLRELNTLINTSAHWKDRKQPLRFIYAIKDSLFEKLGEEPQDRGRKTGKSQNPAARGELQGDEIALAPAPPSRSRFDAAEAAVERANRTKFFEIVIPVVPFLSHSNARDLLSTALEKLRLPAGTAIDRELLDLVARHATDMRLLINICNEFVVFAQRLLWIKTPAPGMTADDLFALVVYKNFHMADFEKLPHRGSALDTLELTRQELVQHSIQQLQRDRRELHRVNDLQRNQSETAQELGDRFNASLFLNAGSLVKLEVGDAAQELDAVFHKAFWRSVAEAGALTLTFRERSRYNQQADRPVRLSYDQLVALFPEGMDPQQWREPDADELATQRATIDSDIASLRGAGFADLVKNRRFSTDGMTFDKHLEIVLESELARDLVRRGFVNRYYAEYSAAFYGDFLGVDVANFFRNSVWPNEMDVQFEFTTQHAVKNLLEQAPAGFASSRSVFNVQIVDYMLEYRSDLAKEVIAFFVAEQGEDSLTFLDAFLNDTSSRKTCLVRLLASHPWRGLLDHLAFQDSVPDEETRTKLLDAALMSARSADSYDLGEQARALVIERHAQLEAFKDEHNADKVDVILSFVRHVGLLVPSLRPLSNRLRLLVVEEGAYELTADNLRAALGIDDDQPITLDRIHSKEAVWHRCRDNVDAYFDALNHDDRTVYAVQAAETLGEVISEQHGDWSDDEIERVLKNSAPEAALTDITEVPQAAWSAIAAARRMVPSAVNLHIYARAFGVDEYLAKVLVNEQDAPVAMESLEDVESDVIHDLMVWILNASQMLGSTNRVRLALQLRPNSRHDPLEATNLKPSGDDLLADLLKVGLVPDTAATFEHFLTAGWRSVSKAFEVSQAVRGFLTPELVAGHVRDLLHDPHVPGDIKADVVADLGGYSEDGDGHVLGEAASIAHERRIPLPLLQVERAAPHVSDPEHILWQLANMSGRLDGIDAMRILTLLGGDYAGFNGVSGHEFDVLATDSVRAVLDRLRANRLVELPRGGKRGRKKVKLV